MWNSLYRDHGENIVSVIPFPLNGHFFFPLSGKYVQISTFLTSELTKKELILINLLLSFRWEMFQKSHNLLIVYKKRREKKLRTMISFTKSVFLKKRARHKLHFIQDGPSEKWCENCTCSEQLSCNSLFPKSNVQKNSTDIKVSLGLRSCPSAKVTTDKVMGNTIKSEDFLAVLLFLEVYGS